MNSKYIMATLNKYNQFIVDMSFKFEGVDDTDISIIIDTGCSHSHISIDQIYIFMSDKERLNTKYRYMKKYITKNRVGIGRGVESANKKINSNIRDVYNKNIKIIQNLNGCKINNVDVGDLEIAISYDTEGIALLGMEILKDWDFHVEKIVKAKPCL